MILESCSKHLPESENMRVISYFILLFSVLSFNTLANEPKTMDNPYQLTTEKQLIAGKTEEINQFWKNEAKFNSFQGVDNIKISTVSILNNNSKVIVIAQGRNESVLKYKEVAFDFAKQGYDIYLIDHRGQGFSERFGGDPHRGHVERFQDYTTDLNQYVESLNLTEKYQDRYILSHSMGGAITSLYLEHYESPFQAAAFTSPMLSISLHGIPEFLVKAITYIFGKISNWFSNVAWYVFGEGAYHHKTFEKNGLTTSEVRFKNGQQGFKDAPETQLGGPTMWWIYEAVNATEEAINNADKIKIPFILLQAGSDHVVTSEGQNEFVNNATHCTNNQFLRIENAEHELLIEKDKYRTPAITAILNYFQAIQQGKISCIK